MGSQVAMKLPAPPLHIIPKALYYSTNQNKQKLNFMPNFSNTLPSFASIWQRVSTTYGNLTGVDKKYFYWRVRILYSMYFGYVVYYFTRKSLIFAQPLLMQQMHISKTSLGLLGSSFYLTYGVSKFLSGVISDKSNPRYFMAFGLIMTGILNLLFGFTSSMWLFALIWILNGFFQGWGWPPCARLLTHWYAKSERGMWWGIWNTSHNVGGALIPLIVAFSAIHWGWRYAMIIPGVIAIISGFLLLERLRDVPKSMGLPEIEDYMAQKKEDKNQNNNESSESEEISKTQQAKSDHATHLPTKDILFKYVLNNPYIWVLSLVYILIYIVRTAINDWGNVYLHEQGFSLMASDSALSFFEIGGFFGSLVSGFASDLLFKSKRLPVIIIFCVGTLISVIGFGLLHSHSFILNAACIFMIGFMVFGPHMLVGMAAAEYSHPDAAGTATGFLGLFGYLGAALSGYPLAELTQSLGWHAFFTALTICSAVTIVILMFLKKNQ